MGGWPAEPLSKEGKEGWVVGLPELLSNEGKERWSGQAQLVQELHTAKAIDTQGLLGCSDLDPVLKNCTRKGFFGSVFETQ